MGEGESLEDFPFRLTTMIHLDCHEMARYTAGKMSVREKGNAERHLLECKGCRETLAIVVRSLRPQPRKEPLIWRVLLWFCGRKQESGER